MTKLKPISKTLIVFILCLALVLSLPFTNFTSNKNANTAHAATTTVGAFTLTLDGGGDLTRYSDYTFYSITTPYGSTDLLTIITTASLTIGMQEAGSIATRDSIRIRTLENKTSNITVDGVKISTSGISPFSVVGGGTLSLMLKSGNSFYLNSIGGAGLEIRESSSLIMGEHNEGGSLIARGYRGAGIGGGNGAYTIGDITINGGVLIAAGYYGAGIGGGYSTQTIGDITINGGSIYASAGIDGAGIGGGYGSQSIGTITINGGSIYASAGIDGAGIGGGRGDSTSPTTIGAIAINGGSIYASAGIDGAGIGGGG